MLRNFLRQKWLATSLSIAETRKWGNVNFLRFKRLTNRPFFVHFEQNQSNYNHHKWYANVNSRLFVFRVYHFPFSTCKALVHVCYTFQNCTQKPESILENIALYLPRCGQKSRNGCNVLHSADFKTTLRLLLKYKVTNCGINLSYWSIFVLYKMVSHNKA